MNLQIQIDSNQSVNQALYFKQQMNNRKHIHIHTSVKHKQKNLKRIHLQKVA